MDFKAGQIYRSEKHGAEVVITNIKPIGFECLVSFKIEVAKDNWQSCTEWKDNSLEQFLKGQEFTLVA